VAIRKALDNTSAPIVLAFRVRTAAGSAAHHVAESHEENQGQFSCDSEKAVELPILVGANRPVKRRKSFDCLAAAGHARSFALQSPEVIWGPTERDMNAAPLPAPRRSDLCMKSAGCKSIIRDVD